MRAFATMLPFALVACTYPEFKFENAVLPDSAAAIDSSEPDTSDAVDTAMVDTFVPDTFVPDTFKPDTFKPDTFKPDLGPDVAPSGCAVMHDFCANFDTATTPSTGWSGSFGMGTAALSLSTAKYISPSKSLLATTTASMATASAMVQRNFTVPTSGTEVRVEADIMVDSLNYAGPGNLILLKVQHSSAGDGVSITVGAGTVYVEAQGFSTVRFPLTGITAGKWFHLRLDAVVHTTAGSAKVYIDDMTTPQLVRTGLSAAEADDLVRQLLVGSFAYLGSSAFTVRFDDVSLDVP